MLIRRFSSVAKLLKPLVKHNVELSTSQKVTTIRFPGSDSAVSFHNGFLRDSSQSLKSWDPTTGQKLFTTGEIADVVPLEIDIPDSETISIQWSDGDFATYSRSFLEHHASPSNRTKGRNYDHNITIWDNSTRNLPEKFPSLLKHDYNSYMTSSETLSKVVRELNEFGLSIITNIPTKSDELHDTDPEVEKIGLRIGYIRPTFYGLLFDVKSKPKATNIAYTSKFLPLHQDLCYYESPPGLQLLHCIKNRATGGENVFADGFSGARYVKNVDPRAYSALLKIPFNFHYNREGHHYFHQRCLVVENPDGSFKEINYSPPFQAPFDKGIMPNETQFEEFDDFLRGVNLFEEFVNSPDNKVKFKTQEGDCVIFDNRRVLHARDEFDPNSGERWLKGCYLDKDAFQSKLRAVECPSI
ncbi:CYFA0S27e00892g1_1 [Cyberlindnera fabianii]|uniref:CYFA0S27e00892g1_1 n=1 Tax=Cyberlindnera fabianii TaxID=36022 RepID=A0A061BAR1_CYBFA|nr:CYFA0S27e00892g1_1 [Cyberlindnera fabianii]